MTSNATRTLRLAAFMMMTTIVAWPSVARSQTLITLPDGQVQGHLNDGTREFLGIPYAAPPVGALRWRPPAPAEPWGGVLDAASYSSACPSRRASRHAEREGGLPLPERVDPGPGAGRIRCRSWSGSTAAPTCPASTGDFVPLHRSRTSACTTPTRSPAPRRRRRDDQLSARRPRLLRTRGARRRGSRPIRTPGTRVCSISAPRSIWVTTISRRSAAIRATSPSSASRRARGTSAYTWPRRCRTGSSTAPSARAAAAPRASRPPPRPRPPRPT